MDYLRNLPSLGMTMNLLNFISLPIGTPNLGRLYVKYDPSERKILDHTILKNDYFKFCGRIVTQTIKKSTFQ